MSEIVNEVRKGFYLDSVALMRLSAEVSALAGIEEAVVMTGTPTNHQIMQDAGLLNDTGATAGANDLIIAMRSDGKSSANRALAQIEKSLQGQSRSNKSNTQQHSTLTSAFEALPEMNLALISTPGISPAKIGPADIKATATTFPRNTQPSAQITMNLIARLRLRSKQTSPAGRKVATKTHAFI